MTVRCWTPLLGKRIRVTSLDECANPPAAATLNAYVATDGFISVTLSAQVEDGAEIITRKADGSLCVNEKLADSFKRFTVAAEFCYVNPALLALLTNAETYDDWNDVTAGIVVPEGTIDKNFSLELWTGLTGQACVPGQASASGYLVLPFVRGGVLGDLEVNGENAISFTLTGAYTKGGNAWGVGPYKVLLNDDVPAIPAPLPTALDPLDHLLLIDTAVAPPPSNCGSQTMPPVNATDAFEVVGLEGTWGPFGFVAPAAFGEANTWGVVAHPATKWSSGSFVQGTTPGAPGKMYWTNATWATGVAPP